MRLFAAVRPPDDVLEHLDLALRNVAGGRGRDRHAPVRWAADENRHVTVAFFGEVPDGVVPELADELSAVAAQIPGGELRLRGAGLFAHRTVWIGVGGEVEIVHRLSAGSAAAGHAVGTRPDERARDRPHLTVGRVAPGTGPGRGRGRRRHTPGGLDERPDPVEALVHALAVYEGPAWRVHELRLMASQPGAGRGGGPLYTQVAGWELGAPSA